MRDISLFFLGVHKTLRLVIASHRNSYGFEMIDYVVGYYDILPRDDD